MSSEVLAPKPPVGYVPPWEKTGASGKQEKAGAPGKQEKTRASEKWEKTCTPGKAPGTTESASRKAPATATASGPDAETSAKEGGQRRPRPLEKTKKPARNGLTAEERARRSRIRKAAPRCPLRLGEPCTLCQAFVTGPQDCQTVRMVMEDPELRELLAQKRRAHNAQQKANRGRNADARP